jgi:hypothetical protein
MVSPGKQNSFELRSRFRIGTVCWRVPGCFLFLALAGLIFGASPSSNTLVSAGSTWKYLDDGSNQGTAWRALAFDDASWAGGAAELGYGDNDEATVVGFGPNADNRYLTTYFRHLFEVGDPSQYGQLILRVLRDDGAVVYLNNREVFRNNMPGGAIAFTTRASTGVGGADEETFHVTSVAVSNLVAGQNILAVEVHQSSTNSTDISFDLQLIGTFLDANASLIRGPYLQNGTTQSVTVRWRTDLPSISRVDFGTTSGNLDQSVIDPALVTEHIVTLANLQPDTRYFYALTTSSNVLASGLDYFFVTAPPVGIPRPVRMWILGDSGTANANARAVRDAYFNYANANGAADIWLMLGDNAYNSGFDNEYQAAVFDTYPTILRNKVLWPTLGNHETAQHESIGNFAYLDIFTLPTSGEAGGVASGTERYYSFDYANVHFVCLDSMTSTRSASSVMASWLQSDLAAHGQDWVIAFFHHPPYTKGSHNSDVEGALIEIRQNIVPILESYGVDLVLTGHSHSYERSYLLNGHYGASSTLTPTMKVDPGDGRTDGNGAYVKSGGVGAVHVVAGSSGQISGGPLNHPAMIVSLNELASVIIDVNSNRLDLKMLNSATTVRDYFTIIKQAAPVLAFERFANQGFKVRRGEFAQGSATLTAAGPASAEGGKLQVVEDWVIYAPPPNHNDDDTFPYTLSDGRILTATVGIKESDHSAFNVIADDLGNGSVFLRGSGIPGRTYSIQFCNDLSSPVWQELTARAADDAGTFEYIDTPPGGTTRFYRSKFP